VVADGEVPDSLRQNMEAWVGCLAGSLEIETYKRLLTDAGFEDISVTITRRYTVAETGSIVHAPGWLGRRRRKLAGAFVRATKPSNRTREQSDSGCSRE
jgi:hypothetical protein